MTSTSNIPTSTASAAVRSFTSTTGSAKSPARPQAPQPSTFPIYHPYPPSQTVPIKPPQAQTLNTTSSQGIIYPVASSGRGFMPRPVRPPDQPLLLANNPNLNHPRGVGLAFRASSTGLAHHNHNHNHNHAICSPVPLIRQHPTHVQHHTQHHHFISGSTLTPINGIPITGSVKAASSPIPASDSNGYKISRDRSRDDNFITIRDRKVKITDGASLYALCRSWLRNGFLEENQPQYGDFIKVLPRPLPESDAGTQSPKKCDKEVEEDEEDEQSVDNLSADEILKRHIMRAKKVRARLREGRLKRIARYKTRLAMLLPAQVEPFRNENAHGN